MACAQSIGREKALLGDLSAFPQKEAGPAGARQGAPTENQTEWCPRKQRPPSPWKPQHLVVFARDALGFGPGNAAHFSLALAYLTQSEGEQGKEKRSAQIFLGNFSGMRENNLRWKCGGTF